MPTYNLVTVLKHFLHGGSVFETVALPQMQILYVFFVLSFNFFCFFIFLLVIEIECCMCLHAFINMQVVCLGKCKGRNDK